MNTKILIIGQAPPAVKQEIPYDTTLLYDMFSWVGISKEQAQDIFDFDAVYNKFTGHNPNGGHNKPTMEQMNKYWEESLRDKVFMATTVIVLGNVARDFIRSKTGRNVIEIIHPSKRNYSKIMATKEDIIKKLNRII